MKNSIKIAVAVCLSLSVNCVYAYGAKGGSAHCEKPVFSNFQPAVNKYLQSFSEFSFMTSSNTVPTSIEVNISLGGGKLHFGPKDLTIQPHANGQLEVSGRLNRPAENGFARLSVTAHSRPGCEHTDGILIRIH